jgi:hypothetical protein
LGYRRFRTVRGIESVIKPWSDQDSWLQMKLSLEMSVKSQGMRLDAARKVSHQIARKIHSINGALDTLCQSTCNNCRDICCGKATLWYDFRDLLFIYLYSDSFPNQQISKNEDLSCSCLTMSGCRLNRCERPFICTWYICPKQIEAMQDFGIQKEVSRISSIIEDIKLERKVLENMFVEVVC